MFPREVRARFPVREALSLTFRSRCAPIPANHPARLQFFCARSVHLARCTASSCRYYNRFPPVGFFRHAVLQRGLVVVVVSSTGNTPEYLFSRRPARSLNGYTIAVGFQSLSRAIMRNKAAVATRARSNSTRELKILS